MKTGTSKITKSVRAAIRFFPLVSMIFMLGTTVVAVDHEEACAIRSCGDDMRDNLQEPVFPEDSLSGRECYLFAYFTSKNNNRNGLHFAWSTDGYRWTAIGPEYSFLKSDFGSWGTEKKMRDPFIMRGPDGVYHCLWTINWDAPRIGHAATTDFIHWSRQSYPEVMAGFEARNCWAPEMIWDEEEGCYLIFWASTIRENGAWKTEPGYKYDHRMYCTTTKDFKSYTPARLFFDPGHNVIDATIRKVGGRYYMIYKDERELPEPQKNLLVAVSEKAAGPYRRISATPFTRNWVEGAAIVALPDSTFLVVMEAYREHHYEAQFTRDFVTFEDVTAKISFPPDVKHGSIVTVPGEKVLALIAEQERGARVERENTGREGVEAPKPLFRDPVYDGAADPVVVWNPQVNKWWMFYTNRRATMTELPGVSWVFGTPIGIAESADGASWRYVGTAEFPDLPAECGGNEATLWAPDIVRGDDGLWHMYLSIQPGIDVKWGLPGFISHLTSSDLRNWTYEQRLDQLGTHVIDADILRMEDGTWRMFYKASKDYSHIGMIESRDLYTWSAPREVLKISGEGPAAFRWKDFYWLIIDTWKGQAVYRSKDGDHWERQPGDPLLPDGEGTGLDDIPNGLHANVVTSNDRTWMVYFTHPGRVGEDKKKDGYAQRRTSIQVVELELTREGWITADRNRPTYVQLFPETPVKARLTAGLTGKKPISDLLWGVFFEDINYAADGGLYGELVQNRSFEYTPEDTGGRDSTWNGFRSWRLTTYDGARGDFRIDDREPLHVHNPHYAVVSVSDRGEGVGLSNEGFDGIVVSGGEKYLFSVFARQLKGRKGTLKVRLTGENGEVLAEAEAGKLSGRWTKHKATLVPAASARHARLEVLVRVKVCKLTGSSGLVSRKGEVALDMVSLFPEKTFKGRSNGLRADLAQAVADLKPRFLRFPGGCLVHGDGLDNMYRWQYTVGPVEGRKGQRNIWNYHQSAGLGYYEYFQFCEDIGAEPVPVVPAAVSCQNSRDDGQKGLPMEEMEDYLQEVLDLIEFANGDPSTPWGKVRAEAGHPAPFGLKYLGIGNEELISDTFEERFRFLHAEVSKQHPEITVIGTVGPFSSGTDYEEGWKIADQMQLEVVDEHYYQPPGWFIHHQSFYDQYSRSRAKVYLGEYASWGNSWYNALAEAAYMTALERNGDQVVMASYAPLLAKEWHTQWGTDLIFFNNTEVKPTVNYQVQKLFSLNAGDEYLPGKVEAETDLAAVERRIATSVVRESSSGDVIVKMVNLLPVAVEMEVNLEDAVKEGSSAVKTLMAGAPGERTLQPVTTMMTVDSRFPCILPPHSLTVVRLVAP